MDEMWGRLYCKQTPCWLWHAINHENGEIIAFVLGTRKHDMLCKLYTLLCNLNLDIEGYLSKACLATTILLFVSWTFAAWTLTDSRHPKTSTTICRFLPFVFFPHLFHVRLHRLLFLHFANLLLRNLVFLSSPHSLLSPFTSWIYQI